MDQKETQIAFNIVNSSLNIVLTSIRREIKDSMDQQGNVNGFALLVLLNSLEKKLKIYARHNAIEELND